MCSTQILPQNKRSDNIENRPEIPWKTLKTQCEREIAMTYFWRGVKFARLLQEKEEFLRMCGELP